jgi:hypothetical protein
MMTCAPLEDSTAAVLLVFGLSIGVQALVGRKWESTFALKVVIISVGLFLLCSVKAPVWRIRSKSSGQLQDSLMSLAHHFGGKSSWLACMMDPLSAKS